MKDPPNEVKSSGIRRQSSHTPVASPRSINSIEWMPVELILKCLSYCTVYELAVHVGRVCKYFNFLCKDETLWKTVCIQQYKATKPLFVSTWKEFYRRKQLMQKRKVLIRSEPFNPDDSVHNVNTSFICLHKKLAIMHIIGFLFIIFVLLGTIVLRAHHIV